MWDCRRIFLSYFGRGTFSFKMCSNQWFTPKEFQLRLLSSGIWCSLVWWTFTNISEEPATTITLKMEINISSETMVYSCQIRRVTFQ